MRLTRLVVPPASASKLSADERSFFALIGQFSNDLTILHKLVNASFREPPDKLEHAANAVLVSVLLKALASKLWQGWELVRRTVDSGCLGKSHWLRNNANLQAAIAKLCVYYSGTNTIKTIRNKFGAHYDRQKLAKNLPILLEADGFEVLYSDRAINAFYITSEAAAWSAILGTTDEHEFPTRMSTLAQEVAARSLDFLELLNLISQAFITHVVSDVGGAFETLAESEVTSIEPKDAVLPLFVA
jgi:hypothetical protein